MRQDQQRRSGNGIDVGHMENQKNVICPENEELATHILNNNQEMDQNPKGISENISKTLQKAYTNLCSSKIPIKTLKEFSEIKLMEGYFEVDDRGASSSEETDDLNEKDVWLCLSKWFLKKRDAARARMIKAGEIAKKLKQAWGSLGALIGRLRAAYEENGSSTETNQFASDAIRIYLREVKECQAKARGIPCKKKKKKAAPRSSDHSRGDDDSTSSQPFS